ncbi:MAG: hypothetical protein EOO05_09580 [Chitinophagaceae bacterium]|nr:MAG: hypothetical protein EOO05_09580 [Chitinophagaceae bacterium]
MKTYHRPGTTNSVTSTLKKIILPAFIIIISLPAFSQELAIVKSSYQHIASVTSWSETIKTNEGGAANWLSLTRNNGYTQKVATEKNMDIVENSFKVCLDNRRAVINWSSYQDLNTNFYVIERSVNGQPFKEVAQIFTSPDSTAKFDYQYFDKLTTDIKGTIFYRIKILDGNEQAVYTPVQLASSNKSYENLLVSLKS